VARITITAMANHDDVQQIDVEGLVAALDAAMAVLVADGASPTQAHVTTAAAALTALKVVWASDFIIDYNRTAIMSQNLQRQAMRAMAPVMNATR